MAKPPVSRILPGAAKVALRGVPGVGEVAMAVDGSLQAVTVLKEQHVMDKRLRERRRESQGFRAKAFSVLDATKERAVQHVTGTARIAAAALTGIRTNPEMQDNGTLAAMYRNLDEGEIEVVLYDTAKIGEGADAAFVGYVLADCKASTSGGPANGCHWRVQLAAARIGYGPLLYSTAATMLNTSVYPSMTLSADARRFWKRQDKDFIEPLMPEEFKRRFGVSVRDLLKRSTATRKQTFDMRGVGHREVSRVYGSHGDVAAFASTLEGQQASLADSRRWEMDDDRSPLKYINEEAQEYAREDLRSKTEHNPSDVKRRLAQAVVRGVSCTCPICGCARVTEQDVHAIPGTAGNSPGKVTVACAACRCGGRVRPASDALAQRMVKPQGTLFAVRAPLRISARTESDREKARSGERVKWAGWTHLERRIQERVAPHADRADVQAFVRSVGQVLQAAIPSTVRIGERDSLLLRIGDYGGVHLSPLPEEGALLWGTWFPPDSSWYPRASQDAWALAASQKITRLADGLKATRLHGNPLVGWETNKIRPSEVHSVFRILTGPRSEEYYEKAFRNVPFDIRVVVYRRSARKMNYVEQEQEERQEQDMRSYLATAALDAKQVVLLLKLDERMGANVGTKYTPGRVARFTPFMLLHRLFDEVYDRLTNKGHELAARLRLVESTVLGSKPTPGTPETLEIQHEDEELWFPDSTPPNPLIFLRRWIRFASLGVDTAAGRNAACSDGDQALADLFAKYCLTGKVAFDPYVLPPGVTREEFEQGDSQTIKKLRNWMRVRAEGAKAMKGLFDEVIGILREGQLLLI